MKAAAFQMDIAWESPRANREKVEKWIGESATGADLVVLPEMFSTGFSMEPEHIAEAPDGETARWMSQTACRTGKAIVGSLAVRDHAGETGSIYYNRLYFVEPTGECHIYDKRHLFRMGEEHHHYQGGNQRVIVEFMGLRFLPLVCYDLRFPVWSRNRNDYDVLIYIASWPAARAGAWKALLRARAIENQAYLIGVNRCGNDPKLAYTGGTVILDFKGEALTEATDGHQEMILAPLEKQLLDDFRAKFPAWMDADDFTIQL